MPINNEFRFVQQRFNAFQPQYNLHAGRWVGICMVESLYGWTESRVTAGQHQLYSTMTTQKVDFIQTQHVSLLV
jgi:hypothetical protein